MHATTNTKYDELPATPSQFVFTPCSYANVSIIITTPLVRGAYKGSVHKVFRLLAVIATEVLVVSYGAAMDSAISRAVH